ncbi:MULTISPECIES: LysR family transcriptional regulator [unclassified Streptomyces]|uniref:LysR family transcriptional regulator n=1 Tax=unclassified Streptomyces TaxID=2593676 RepID=UPI000B874F7D|nr:MULTISPECIES: LysR substrate-binding domain-containing protein [unclassified Streptomyces]MYS24392.1 LysR family transcriptional regulator [Streptomyces sp. SID4948]
MDRDHGGALGPSSPDPNPDPDPDARREPTTHQLRLFLVLAEELHFGRAAARLFMTQPALSRQIRALETALGLQLVQRSSRSVELTAAGRALLPDVKAAADAMARLRGSAGLHQREVAGHLVIGAIGAEAAMPYTRTVLAELGIRHPRITVEIRAVNFTEQIEALMDGELDAAFLRPPLPPRLHTLQLATEARLACLPADDPLAARQPITLAQLAGRPVVDVPAGAPRLWWDDWVVNPRPDGTPVRFGPVAADIEAMLLAVARGEAIAFLPAAARQLYPRPGVAYVEVTDLPLSTAALAWLPRNPLPPALAALLRTARTVVRRGGATA